MGMVLKVVGDYQVGCDLNGKLFMINPCFWSEFDYPSTMSKDLFKRAVFSVDNTSGSTFGVVAKVESIIGGDSGLMSGLSFSILTHELCMIEEVTYTQDSTDLGKTNAKKFLTSSLLGRSFKGIPLKLIGNAGMKLPERLKVIDQFKGCEFLLKRTSNNYIYGFPVGHPDKVMAFDFGSVKFYHDGQDFDDCEPYVRFFHMIKGNLAGYNISEIQE